MAVAAGGCAHRTRAGGALVALALAACKHQAAEPPTPAPAIHNVADAAPVDAAPSVAAFPALAQADFVVLADPNQIIAYALVDDAPKALGTLLLPHPDPERPAIGGAAWFVTRDELVVAGIDHSLWIVTTAGAQSLRAPSDDLFKSIPKSRPDDDEQVPEAGGKIVSATGAVWWDHCAWGGEGGLFFECNVDAYTRLWPVDPTAHVTTELSVNDDPGHDLFSNAPALFPVKQTGDEKAATCGSGRKTVVLSSPTKREQSDMIQWFGAPAPGLLVSYIDTSEDAHFEANEYALYDACRMPPVAAGNELLVLHGDVWVGKDVQPTPHPVLRRGLKILGELPDYSDVVWRASP